jgi:hypothetical protein
MKLQAPKGTKRVSFAGIEYEVAADGTVDVPDEALEPLLAHGFALAGADEPMQKDPPAPKAASAPRPAAGTAPGRATR